jgi:hypothetical protein
MRIDDRASVRAVKTALFLMAGVSFLSLSGCSDKARDVSVAPPRSGELESGVVARVGQQLITADGVGRIAAVQGVGVAAARDLAIHDALFAAEAKANRMDAEPSIQQMINAALARRMLRKLLDDADRAGPVTDEELEQVMKRRWLELDRPEGFRVVHAVVRTKEGADEATRGRAEIVARAVREAVMPVVQVAKSTSQSTDGAADPVVEAFRKAADAVAKDGFEIKIESLPPVAVDGRLLVMEGGGLEKAFADGASKLEARGSLSDIVSTSYGFHVLLLLERIPEARVPVEERRTKVRQEVLWGRASAARSKLLQGLRRDVMVERNVDGLLVMVPVDR